MRPRAGKSVAKFAEAQAARHLKALEQHLRRAAKHPDKARTVHELRVSIRRFARVLRMFRLLWDRGHYRKIRRRLREMMDLCGAVRNCDVAVEVLEGAAQMPPAPVPPLKGPALRFRRVYMQQARRCDYLRVHYVPLRRKKAQENLAEMLRHWKAQEVAKPWAGWLRANHENDQDLAAFAKQALRPLVDEYFEAGDRAARAEATFEEMHQFRLLVKQLRYSLDTFGPLAGREWKQGVEEVRAIQDLLGALNDCVTTRALAAGTGKDGSNLLLKLLANLRLNRFQWDWSHKKKIKAWWLRWLCRPRRRRRT